MTVINDWMSRKHKNAFTLVELLRSWQKLLAGWYFLRYILLNEKLRSGYNLPEPPGIAASAPAEKMQQKWSNMLDTEDLIAAVSSAAGCGSRGILRLSGPGALETACRLFGWAPPGPSPRLRRRYRGRCRLTATVTCPAQLYLFPGPNSYTGQDMAEFHLPGSPALLQIVLEQLLVNGARAARPGEFTARAFFHGRLDLSEAEAVAEVINARSDGELRAAQRLLGGALHRACGSISGKLLDMLSLLEAQIDFAEEEIELISASRMGEQLHGILAELEGLLTKSVTWEDLHHLPQVVLAGPANAGKSSLANRLLGMDRSIVSAIAGTTRDALTAPLRLAHGECLLMDTAGLGEVMDPLAGETQNLTRQKMESCDLLLWVVDGAQPDLEENIRSFQPLPSRRPVLVVVNKTDLPEAAKLKCRLNACLSPVFVSALTGENLGELKDRMSGILQKEITDGPAQSLALTARQRQALAEAQSHLMAAGAVLEQTDPPALELLALEIRGAMERLGTISGEIVTEDILGRIFSRFCIGK